jgi:hypothetical protein
MRKVSILIITNLLVTSLSSATADPPPAPVEIQDRIVIEGCRLSSEKPHISEHVPGTVHKMSNGKSITTRNKAAIKC